MSPVEAVDVAQRFHVEIAAVLSRQPVGFTVPPLHAEKLCTELEETLASRMSEANLVGLQSQAL